MSNFQSGFTPRAAQRQNGKLTLHLSGARSLPPIPFELQGHISPDDWAMRVPALAGLAAQYSAPTFERFWLCFALLITIILPLALYRPIFISIYGHDGTNQSEDFVARLIGILIFLGAFLLFWSPLFIWKNIGKRRVNTLLASYATADAARPLTTSFIPKWKIITPGVLSTYTTITITTPPSPPITSFRPEAYLPAYIGKDEDAQGAYFYPYPATSHEVGLPRMSVVGGYNGVHEKV